AREVRFGGYDVVLLAGSFDMALTAGAGLLVTRLKGHVPLAHVCHNVRPLNRWGGEELYVSSGPTIGLLRRLYPSFDLVFVHGERSMREFQATWPPTNLAVVPHGDERLFSEEPPAAASEPHILFFGAWSKMKGLPVLMEAFDELARRRPEVRLTIAGPPVPEEGQSRRVLAWAAERPQQVEALAGYQSGVVHLAMTMRRAVVASDVGDLPEAVADGASGLIVPSRDPQALAAALERVVTDADLAERLGAVGHERMLGGSGWPAVAEQFESAMLTLVSERAATRPASAR